MCEAPLKRRERTKHVVACVTLTMSSMPNLVNPPPPVDEDLAAYCYRIHAEDQGETHLRQATHPDTHLPNQSPAMKKYNDWLREQREGYGPSGGQTFPTPEGKQKCHLCNGITHMYPNCTGCDGKGYI